MIAQRPEDADILMVNTCGFIESAKQESIDAILELVRLKDSDPAKRVVVAGCLGQRYPEELASEIPEIDAIVGMSEYPRMGEILGGLMQEVRDARRVRFLLFLRALLPVESVAPVSRARVSEGPPAPLGKRSGGNHRQAWCPRGRSVLGLPSYRKGPDGFVIERNTP